MWADQVSNEDGSSIQAKKEPAAGYAVEDAEPVKDEPEEVQVLEAEPLTAEPEVQPAEIPPAGDAFVLEAPVEGESNVTAPDVEDMPKPATGGSAPIAFPVSGSAIDLSEDGHSGNVFASSPDNSVTFPTGTDGAAPAAFAFPSSDNASIPDSPALSGTAASTPAVTFQNMPAPERSGTPNDEAGNSNDGKRRRTLSTQGVQRLARRISISGKRQGSSSTSIPAAILNSFKRDSGSLGRESSKDSKNSAAKGKGPAGDDSKDSLNDGAPAVAAEDSANASVNSDITQDKKKKEKKEKKEKKRKSMGPA